MGANFILGERKHLQFEIKSTIGQKVVITEANFHLFDPHGEVEDEGGCIITNGCFLAVLIEPKHKGEYELIITYNVAPEIRKVRCVVNVR